MNFEDVMKHINASLPLYYTMKNEVGMTDEYLPSLPKDFFFPQAGIDIVSDDDCRILLEYCKNWNKEIDELDENSMEYSKQCYFCALLFCPIFDFWFGRLSYKNHESIHNCKFDILSFDFWEYLRGNITYEELKQSGRELYDEYTKYELS